MSVNKNLYAVILAGGSGTRFWPVSRESRPKQFLNIAGKETLLQETLARISQKVKAENILIVAGVPHQKEVNKQIGRFRVPKENVLLEPVGKNTAPAICWAAARIHKINPQATMAVLPADHLIQHKKRFLKVLDRAVALAQKKYLVTLGIVPTRPETGYGYLRTKEIRGSGAFKVAQFTEKPNLYKAKQFVKKRNYFWNSGMFVWRADVILREFQEYLPQIYRAVGVLRGQSRIKKVYKSLSSISVDYGILEKSGKVAAVPARGIGWSDLGSWEALAEILPPDGQGNMLRGDVVALNCRGTFIRGGKRLVAAVGLKDFIIVDTPDALLVCPKALSQEVKNVVASLKKGGRPQS